MHYLGAFGALSGILADSQQIAGLFSSFFADVIRHGVVPALGERGKRLLGNTLIKLAQQPDVNGVVVALLVRTAQCTQRSASSMHLLIAM